MLPLYLEKLSIKELQHKASRLNELLINCRLCPNECNVNRTAGETGICDSSEEVLVSTVGPHYGEEAPLVGTNGSGTIFLTNCNLNCIFCQNYDISHLGRGEVYSISELANAMLSLQNRGCHNLNFVTPTHYTPQIINALILAIEKGFELPIVYNCGGYESVETLKQLENVIDIYMPDIKYSNDLSAEKYSGAKNYWNTVRAAVKEMHRQVGDLKMGGRGIAQRGLLIRHLVLPKDIAGSKEVLEFIAKEISIDTYINIMDQYRPAFQAYQQPEINRRISDDEYFVVVNYAKSIGLSRGFE